MSTETSGNPNAHSPSSFSTGLTGTCLCGAIRVTIHDNELFTKRRGHLCHCANCRKVSGSYVQANLLIEEEKVEVEDPKSMMRKYEDWATGSGKMIQRCFCGVCGSPIQSIAQAYPGKVVVKMGLFPRIPDPECETFAAHRHPWQGKHGDMTQYAIARGGKLLGEE